MRPHGNSVSHFIITNFLIVLFYLFYFIFSLFIFSLFWLIFFDDSSSSSDNSPGCGASKLRGESGDQAYIGAPPSSGNLSSDFKASIDPTNNVSEASVGSANAGPQIFDAVKGSTVQTRQIASQQDVYSDISRHHLPPDFKSDLRPWVNRPFYIATLNWSATYPRFAILNPANPINLPRDVFTVNQTLQNLMKLAAFYRAKLCLNVSVTGTICHQGTLLVSALPPITFGGGVVNTNGAMINTMLSGPHAFLAANEASSTCIEIPWYNNTDFGLYDFVTANATSPKDFLAPSADAATLSIMVLNPLLPATGASTTVNIVIEAFFKELDLYVPSPKDVTFVSTAPTFMGESLWSVASKATDSVFDLGKRTAVDAIDSLRGALRSWTGLHNPNVAKLDTKSIMTFRNYLNVVDSGTCIEKLDPNSTVDRIEVEPLFGTSRDEMLIKNIISKPQYLGSFTVSTTNNTGALMWARPISPFQGGSLANSQISNNIELLYRMTRAWKGSLKIHIQSAMSNKHAVKLKVIKYYAPSSSVYTSYPTLSTILGAPSDLLEYSGGNQILTSELPFLCRNRLTYCTTDTDTDALVVGMYYIYLAQPLVAGDAAPTTVEFNVYMSCGDDFQFYGYSKNLLQLAPINTPNAFVGESAEVMNRPSDQNELLRQSGVDTDIDGSRLVPLVDLRPLIRRFQPGLWGNTTLASTGLASIRVPLSALIAEYNDGIYRGSNGIIPAMFYAKNPGLKLKLKVSPSAITNIQFVAPNYDTSTTSNTINSTIPTFTNTLQFSDYKPSFGVFPLPAVEFPTIWNISDSTDTPLSEYEFVIPNTSVLKFLGGPQKISATTEPNLAVSDFGNLVISFAGVASETISWTIYFAYTDETRLGFQTIAPVAIQPTVLLSGTQYLQTPDGSRTGTTGLPSTTLPVGMYFSTLTTAYS